MKKGSKEVLNIGRLEWGIWVGWFTLIGAGVILLSWKSFEAHWMLGVGFLTLLAIGIMVGLQKRIDKEGVIRK